MDRRLFLLTVLALGGCASAPSPASAPGGPLGELESLYAADAGREAIVIQVGSNGCTAKDDFVFHVERRGGTVTLAFARRRLDPCKSFAMGRAALAFSWAELGIEPRTPVFVLNPLTAWTGPGG